MAQANGLLAEFRQQEADYKSFADEAHKLIDRLLRDAGIRTSQIASRTKSPESLAEKLSRPNKAYSKLASIPDLAGIRVILYDLNDVRRAVEVIEKEFDVDAESSGDAAERLSPDEFGYLSVHLVIRLSPNRRTLSEWRHIGELHAEVQVRTVLQHAWASISHFLQYKREEDVPTALRRRLHRLSALLELADQEFETLRSEHQRLVASDDPVRENELMVLRRALRNSAHSFEWIRSHTVLKLTDAEFIQLIERYPTDLKAVNIIQRDQGENRVIPGKPGIKLRSEGTSLSN